MRDQHDRDGDLDDGDGGALEPGAAPAPSGDDPSAGAPRRVIDELIEGAKPRDLPAPNAFINITDLDSPDAWDVRLVVPTDYIVPVPPLLEEDEGSTGAPAARRRRSLFPRRRPRRPGRRTAEEIYGYSAAEGFADDVLDLTDADVDPSGDEVPADEGIPEDAFDLPPEEEVVVAAAVEADADDLGVDIGGDELAWVPDEEGEAIDDFVALDEIFAPVGAAPQAPPEPAEPAAPPAPPAPPLVEDHATRDLAAMPAGAFGPAADVPAAEETAATAAPPAEEPPAEEPPAEEPPAEEAALPAEEAAPPAEEAALPAEQVAPPIGEDAPLSEEPPTEEVALPADEGAPAEAAEPTAPAVPVFGPLAAAASLADAEVDEPDWRTFRRAEPALSEALEAPAPTITVDELALAAEAAGADESGDEPTPEALEVAGGGRPPWYRRPLAVAAALVLLGLLATGAMVGLDGLSGTDGDEVLTGRDAGPSTTLAPATSETAPEYPQAPAAQPLTVAPPTTAAVQQAPQAPVRRQPVRRTPVRRPSSPTATSPPVTSPPAPVAPPSSSGGTTTTLAPPTTPPVVTTTTTLAPPAP